MDAPIIPIARIEAKARDAFERRVPRDGHDFNWHAAAIEPWQAEWDRCAQAQPQAQVAEP